MPRYRSRVRDSSPAPVKKGKAFFALSLFSFDGREGIIATLSPDGEIGRHKRLKIRQLLYFVVHMHRHRTSEILVNTGILGIY